MGWWPSKLIVVLNIIILLGYNMINCVITGQILSAVSTNGSMTVVVGELTSDSILCMFAHAGRHHNSSCCHTDCHDIWDQSLPYI